MTCPVRLRNTGNVGLQSVFLTYPSSQCSVQVLEPQAGAVTCNVSFTAAQQDFNQGYTNLMVEGVAVPRTAYGAPTISWQGSSMLKLSQIGRLTVQQRGAAPDRVTAAGVF